MGNDKEVSQPQKRILLKAFLGGVLMIGGASAFESLDSQNSQQYVALPKNTTVQTPSLELKEQEIFIDPRSVTKNLSILVFSLGVYVGFKNFWKLIKSD